MITRLRDSDKNWVCLGLLWPGWVTWFWVVFCCCAWVYVRCRDLEIGFVFHIFYGKAPRLTVRPAVAAGEEAEQGTEAQRCNKAFEHAVFHLRTFINDKVNKLMILYYKNMLDIY